MTINTKTSAYQYSKQQLEAIKKQEDLISYISREQYVELRAYMINNNLSHPTWNDYKYKGYTTMPANKINKEMMYRMVYSHTNKGAK